MKNVRASPDIRTDPDIRTAIEDEILLSFGDETVGDGAIEWDVTHGALHRTTSDLVQDAGMTTAVTISLFSDARAEEDDRLPDSETGRRGWWADSLDDTGDRIGSRLWLICREKQTRETLNRAEEYARESLRWMTEDKVAAAVAVKGSYSNRGWLVLDIDITRPDRSVITYKYEYNWQAHEQRLGA